MQIEVNGSDNTTLRVFKLDLPAEAIERFTVQAGTGEWPLKYALGATTLRNGFVDVVDLRDLEKMRLSQYLADAYGLAGSDFKAERNQLDALTGHLVILPAQAFDNTSQTLTIAPQLRLIGTYNETAPKPRGPKLRSDGVKGLLGQGSADLPDRSTSPFLKLALVGLGILALLILAAILR
ncbi:MAG: aspartate carbamoyltransferase catalytic subunit [Pelagimonas sp.]|uniref:aspartate carbamoyltransferase catalytic subunit n=1 Tax=Pelagimonas sp. TaxID=2073170 RepID=UPI003D6AF1E6